MSLLDRHVEIPVRNRLLQILEGSFVQGLEGGIEIGVPGQDDTFYIAAPVPDEPEKLETGHLGHSNVRYHDVHRIPGEDFQGLDSVGCAEYDIARIDEVKTPGNEPGVEDFILD